LDKADAIRKKRAEAIKLTEELLRSAFLEMFGDPVTNPKGWPVRKLGEVIPAIDGGWSPVCEARPVEGDEWGVLKLGCVTYGTYNSAENKAMKFGMEPRPENEVQAGDLLFSRKNTLELVGATAFVFKTPPRFMVPDTVFRLRNDKVSSSALFLWKLLSHPGIRHRTLR
jgi:type I restriction enzyme, S subunit